MEFEDRSGTIRRPDEFAHARKIVIKRLVDLTFMTKDPELAVELGVIVQALEIAENVARKVKS